jgi:AcrR family transcriptional regulator
MNADEVSATDASGSTPGQPDGAPDGRPADGRTGGSQPADGRTGGSQPADGRTGGSQPADGRTGGSQPAGSSAGDSSVADLAAGLPPSLAAAWGLRERPGKGPKRGLSLEQIVAAGVRVAVVDGLAAVSMARVAAELGAGTMALYRYVGAKSELINLMVDAAFGLPPPLPESATTWRAALSHWAWAQLAIMRAHLWAVRVPLSGPPATPNQIAWLEQGLRGLRDTRLAEGPKMSIILLVSGYVRNSVMMEAQISEAQRAAGLSDQQAMLDYGRILGLLADAQRFPELAAVAASGVLSKADDWDEEFVFGLDRILDGIGVLVDSPPSPS